MGALRAPLPAAPPPAAEIAKLPADGSDADLAALCTIDVTELQKAAAKALEEAK